jgi:catechol 2,3-dioxygenase
MPRHSNQGLGENMQAANIPMLESVDLLAPTLRVRDIHDTLSFYHSLGLRSEQSGIDGEGLQMYELGLRHGAPLVKIKHDPEASTSSPDAAGLYHYAILLPTRKSLASTFLKIGSSGIPFDGYADHLVSEALYLHDAEANGIEIYADRSNELWPNWKQLAKEAEETGDYRHFANSMGRPLDFNSLLRELSHNERNTPHSFPDGAKIGHYHLKVTNLARSVEFYKSKLGFDVNMNSERMGAAFLSVGGYHHHIGLNTWHTLDGGRAEEGSTGLEEIAFKVPKLYLEELEGRLPSSLVEGSKVTIEDPDGIKISLSI